MSVAYDLDVLRARFGASGRGLQTAARLADGSREPLRACPGLEELLPDGGLPQGVVELAAPRATAGSTSIALAAVRAAQERSAGSWCAWIDPESTLHAPGVVAAGVNLARLLVVAPPRTLLGRAAVRVVGSGAFDVVVVDFDAIAGAGVVLRSNRKGWAPEMLVRKLALLAETAGTTVLLLTDSTRKKAVPWPLALRIEVARPSRSELSVRVAKDRRGRIGMSRTIPFRSLMHAAG
jgi:recombination protein RecA